ncbi:hypothetical protein [uncultured Winogradskyella sp.]|uniref:hypothetical protein n=1 Tax=uncultured Winogradskyella sp. TaxID=395353 RepID=UPI0026139FE9|nr:hypothetical protein [uncultured Winogradskyella sp.]
MAQDLRDLFKEDTKEQDVKMSKGHDARFLQKLNKELPKQHKTSRFNFLSIAASVVVLLGLSYGAYQFFHSPVNPEEPIEVADTDIKTLGDISPDFKKVEDYYLASINLELSKVQLTPQNKELFDGYVQRLKELNDEYDRLTIELNENGPNEETLDALINNLKYRLNLVMRLKEKLAEYNDDSFMQESI